MLELTFCFSLRASHSLEAPVHRRKDIGDLCGVKHGHNYKVEVTLKKNINPTTGLVVERQILQEIIEKNFQKYQNSHLNENFSFTSGEWLCCEFFKILKQTKVGPYLKSLAIQETPKNRFLYVVEN